MTSYNPDNFYSWYRTLGLEPDCTWDQVRQAYRKNVQSWHPDRFPEESEEKTEAEEIIVKVTHAYRSLSEYQDKHGELPGQKQKQQASKVNDDENSPVEASNPGRPSIWEDDFQQAGAHQTRLHRHRRQVTKYLIVAVIIYGTYNLMFSGPSHETPEFGEKNNPVTEQTALAHPDNSNKLPIGSGQKEPPSFGIGSTQGEVIDIQGTPSRTDGSTWYFGESKVVFKNGKVRSWQSSAENPLRATLDREALIKRTERSLKTSRFTKGSTKADVLAIQGEPLYKMKKVWDYGVSKVYFQDGLVVDWQSSTLSPLKAEENK